MPIAQEYLENILRLTGDKTDYVEASEEAYVRGLQKLNQYIEILRDRELDINSSQTEIESYYQPVNFPSYAIDAIEKNVAVMVWPLSNPGVPVPMDLKQEAKKAQSELMYRHGPSISSVFPANLPLGSGNVLPGESSTNFYPDQDPVMYDGTDYITNESANNLEVE